MGIIARGIRNVIRNPLRFILIVILLGSSLMFVAAMIALSANAQAHLTAIHSQIGVSIDISPAGSFSSFGGGSVLAKSTVNTAEHTAGIVRSVEHVSVQYTGTEVKGIITAPAGPNGVSTGNSTLPISVYGISGSADNAMLTGGNAITMSSGRSFHAGETTLALMSVAMAQANHLQLGATFTLKGTHLTLIGLYTTGTTFADNSILLPIATAEQVFDLAGISSLTVYAATADQVHQLTATLRHALGSKVDIVTQEDQFTSTFAALNAVKNNISSALVAAAITAALVIVFAVFLTVRERVQEIGVLKAIGASHWQVVMQFGVEVLALSMAAAVTATVLLLVAGNAIARAFDITPAASTGPGGAPGAPSGNPGSPGGGLFQGGAPAATAAGHGLSIALTPQTLLVLVGVSIGLALLASSIPAWYVARIKPAQVLRAV